VLKQTKIEIRVLDLAYELCLTVNAPGKHK